MKAALALFSFALLFLGLGSLGAPSVRADDPSDCRFRQCAALGDGAILVGSIEDTPEGKVAHAAQDPVLQWRLVNTCLPEDGQIGGCTAQVPCPAPPDRVVSRFLVQYRAVADGPAAPWVSDGISCVDVTELKPVVTPAMVLAEFEKLPLPAGEVSFQPGDGQVLVNLGAILYTTQAEQAPYDVVILGQAVHIDAFISDYAWHLGDGSPDMHGRGAPYPDEQNLHVYTSTGPVQVGLTLTWSGTYTVDGGPQQDVPGTTTTDSPPVDLTVVQAPSILVDSFD